jgi:hypothetical protein
MRKPGEPNAAYNPTWMPSSALCAVPPSERWLTVALVCIVPRPFLFMGIEILTWSPGNLTFLEAPPKREIAYCQRYGKPRLHVERYLRELHQFKAMSPGCHTHLLSDYFKASASSGRSIRPSSGAAGPPSSRFLTQ